MEEMEISSNGEESYDSQSYGSDYDDHFSENNDSLSENVEEDDDDLSYDSYYSEDADADADDDDYEDEDQFRDFKPPNNPPISLPLYHYRPLKLLKTRTLDDRISGLPDSLIFYILSFLSMKDVVRTAALSKRWRFLWPSVSTLVFQTPDVSEVETRKFAAFVDKALILCKCPNIEQFVLYFRYRHCFASDLDLWIRFATQNNVEDLELLLDFNRSIIESYRLPHHLYRNSSLKKLRLNNCLLIPSNVISWRSLKSLSIEGMDLGDGVIAEILLGSPSLEILKLDHFRFLTPLVIASTSLKNLELKTHWLPREEDVLLEISAPNLQSLVICGAFYRPKFRLTNVSSLINADLNFRVTYHHNSDNGDDCRAQNLLLELLECLQHAKGLKIGSHCLEVLSILEVQRVVPLTFSSCKHLRLDTYVSKWDSAGIARLLQSSPNMETLVIDTACLGGPWYTHSEHAIYSHGEVLWTSEKSIFKCMLPCLQTVKIVGFRGDQFEELPFIQFLLKSARMLKKMDINAGKGLSHRYFKCGGTQLTNAMQSLLSFPRSSPDAVIMLSY